MQILCTRVSCNMVGKLCVIGDINLDLVIHIDSLPGIDEDREVQALQMKPGGTACNTILEIERWRCRAHLFGSRGRDPMGELVELELHNHDFEKSLILSGFLTGLCVVIEDPYGRRLITHRGANKTTIFNLINGKYDLSGCSWIHLSSLEPKALEYVKKIANGSIISYDPGGIQIKRLRNPSLISMVNFLLLNIKEYQFLQFEPSELKTKVVVKKGREGAELIFNNKKIKVEAKKVRKITQTRGAGDVFDGAFISCIFNGGTTEECLKIAINRAGNYIEGGVGC